MKEEYPNRDWILDGVDVLKKNKNNKPKHNINSFEDIMNKYEKYKADEKTEVQIHNALLKDIIDYFTINSYKF